MSPFLTSSSADVPAIYQVDWRVRLLLGGVLLLGAAFNHSLPFAVVNILLAALLVRHIAISATPLWSAMRLLRWLVIPILLLHMLLTPGKLLVSLPPISREGLEQGLWLSLHLVEMFVAAMAMSRLLTWREWLHWLASWPVVGERLVTDARLFAFIQRDARLLIKKQQRVWRQQNFDLALLARLLLEALQRMLVRSEVQADRLWQHWDSSRLQSLFSSGTTVRPHRGMTLAAICLVIVLAGQLAGSIADFFE